ncbi:MAG: hypothetical protein IT580_00665 [Verrucomicrobiales bacterium]|nr:hypothetical protein [Verrucomicrobiales bacterium]
MSRSVSESEWKTLQKLKPTLLDRLCQRILDEIEVASTRPETSPHQRYLDVYELMERRDHDVGYGFTNWTRAQAMDRILAMQKLELFTEEELQLFSAKTRETLDEFYPHDDE